LDASEFLPQYLEEFSYLHSLVEGFPEIKELPPSISTIRASRD